MRAWYVDRRNEPILDVRMMVSFACALILVLSWLLPREEFFREMLADRQPDHVSLAYARLLVTLNPEDEELRSLLAAQYLHIGEMELAWATIVAPASDRPASPHEDAALLRVTILLELVFSQTEERERQGWEALLAQELDRAGLLSGLDESAARKLADAAYAIGRPELAAAFFERRYLAHGSSDDLLQAAAAWQSADMAERGADLFAGLISTADPVSADLVRLGLAAFLAAGRFEQGFEFIDRMSAAGLSDPSLLVAFADFALRADSPSHLRRYLRGIDPTVPLTDAELGQLARAATAAGELTQAARLYERLLVRHPEDRALRTELARVFRWSDRPDAALDQWLELLDRTGDEQFLSAAWPLAQALYRYETVARLLSELAVNRRLSDEEVSALRMSYEQSGLPEAGIATLKSYLERHPEHRLAWLTLIDLQEGDGNLAHASDSWALLARLHELDVKERLRWADLLWQQYRTEEAVALLLAAENSDLVEYWQRLATYAWFLDDMSLVARSNQASMQLEALDEGQFQRLLSALALTDMDEAQRLSFQAWEQFQNPDYLTQALQWSLAARDYDLVRSLLTMMESLSEEELELVAGSAGYWELLAYYHQQQGDLPRARAVLAEALEYHPERISLIAAYLWALIDTVEVDDLGAALERYRPVADTAGDLWSVYASGYASLNDHPTALYWFARSVDVTPDDLPLLLAYASSLDASGLGDSAFRVRRYVVSRISEGHASPGTRIEHIAQAGSGILTDQQEQILAGRLHTSADGQVDGVLLSEALPRLYLAQALEREHYSAASYWLQRDSDADVWKRLAVAADRRDRTVLEALLAHEDPLVRVNAALALDRPEVAYREVDTARMDDQARLGLARSYYERFPTGWQIGPEISRISDLDIDSLTLAGSGRVGVYSVGGSVSTFRLSDSLRLVPGEVDEWYLEGWAARQNRFGEGRASVSLLDSNGEVIPGLTASQTLNLSRRHQVTLRGAYQQLTEITALARVVSQRSGLDLGWQSLLSRRQRLNVRASWDFYQDRFGDTLGHGGQFEARLDHALKLAGPEFLLGTSLYLTSNTEEEPGSTLLEKLLIDRGERLLPERTGRLALNASLARGSPGDLRWQYPSPRYRLGAAVGYQWPENSPTLEFEANVGFRILGNDELSIRTAYTSSLLSAVGGDGYRATLIYSRRLGR